MRLPAAFRHRGRKNMPSTTTVAIEPTPAQIVSKFCLDITYKHGGPTEAARFIGLWGENAVQELQAIFKHKNPTETQLEQMRLWLRSSTEEIRSLLAETSP